MSAGIVLCGRRLPAGFALEVATVVADLCERPFEIGAAAAGADRLVLGVCDREYSLGRLQTEARKIGIDPLGMQVVALSATGDDPARLEVLLAAALARATAFVGSEPHHAKPTRPASTSRRDLLRGGLLEYRAAPAIDAELCTAATGCRACVDVCPTGALTWARGVVGYDKVACEPCGLCVTTCPVGAADNPAITPAQVEAEVRALLDADVGPPGPRGIVYSCSRGEASAPGAAWYPVEVPCTGMVTAAWLLAPLAMGAGAVAAVPCAAGGCPLGQDGRLTEALGFCRDVLAALGLETGRVGAGPDAPIGEPLAPTGMEDPFGPGAGGRVLLALGAAAQSSGWAVEHPGSPVGQVTINPRTCTACTMCARACPPGALAWSDTDQVISLTFDAARCTACGQCVLRCPERARHAITLLPMAEHGLLDSGRVELHTAAAERCEACGGPIGSGALLDRIDSLLGAGHAGTVALVRRLCVDCRARRPPAPLG